MAIGSSLGNVISVGTATITRVLLGLLLMAAVLVWLCERHANPEHFSPRPLRGITDGLWWAALTLTTVGYGDKAPRTRAGRLIGVIWMFAAVVLIALFTAQVTSSLTVTSLSGRVRGPADLGKVGAIQDSPGAGRVARQIWRERSWLPWIQTRSRGARTSRDRRVRRRRARASYEIAHNFSGHLAVVGEPFMRVDYVFALPLGSAYLGGDK